MPINNKLIIIAGPTCTSKNSLAMMIAKNFNGEIINADAFQVYKDINIGVNKPSMKNMVEIKHHLISFLNYNDPWDIALFQEKFNLIYKQIISRNKIAILCGGSHMYIDSILSGYNLTKYNLDNEIKNLDENYSNEKLYKYILDNDSEYAQKISINNRRRLLRVVAIMQKENESMTNLNKKNKSLYDSLLIICSKDRQEIYNSINKRVLELLSNDKWLNEVKDLLVKNKEIINYQCFKAIGYKEVYDAIIHNKIINFEIIQQKTRQYAKRQLTWCNNKFKNYKNKIIYDWNNPIDINSIIQRFLQND